MIEWLPVILVGLASLAVWKWVPPPANWVLGGLSLLSCALSGYALLKQQVGRSAVVAALGFLVVGVVPGYDWAIRPALPSSGFWADYGLLLSAALFVVVAPVLGVLSSKLMLTPRFKVTGVALALAPFVLGALSATVYWLFFVTSGSASHGSVERQKLMALLAVPALVALGIAAGVALHRSWLGLLEP